MKLSLIFLIPLLLLVNSTPCRAGAVVHNSVGLDHRLVEDPAAVEDATGDLLNPMAISSGFDEIRTEVVPDLEGAATAPRIAGDSLLPALDSDAPVPVIDSGSSTDVTNLGSILSLHSAGLSYLDIVGYELTNPWLSGGALALTVALGLLIVAYRRSMNPEPPPL